MASSSRSRTSYRFMLALIIVGVSSYAGAFQLRQHQPHEPSRSSIQSSATRLHESNVETGRRKILNRGVGSVMSILVGGTMLDQPAEASYSAYTAREKDWQQRMEKGEIKISSASSLRQQLREIAPMNDEGSKIFCPNGASAAVSPLMENKCGDRQALPSVYGRTEDSMGNSIPGFSGSGSSGASAESLRAELNAQAYFRSN